MQTSMCKYSKWSSIFLQYHRIFVCIINARVKWSPSKFLGKTICLEISFALFLLLHWWWYRLGEILGPNLQPWHKFIPHDLKATRSPPLDISTVHAVSWLKTYASSLTRVISDLSRIYQYDFPFPFPLLGTPSPFPYTLEADDFPFLSSQTVSKVQVSPSFKLLKPWPDWIAEKCTKTSSVPSSGVMNPNPFSALKNFTVPDGILIFFLCISQRRYQKKL